MSGIYGVGICIPSNLFTSIFCYTPHAHGVSKEDLKNISTPNGAVLSDEQEHTLQFLYTYIENLDDEGKTILHVIVNYCSIP